MNTVRVLLGNNNHLSPICLQKDIRLFYTDTSCVWDHVIIFNGLVSCEDLCEFVVRLGALFAKNVADFK